jgi:transposase-like protein
MEKSLENEHFPGLGEIQAVQHAKNGLFSDKERRLGACGTSYRKVCVYTKSLERWRKEHERRRKVRVLAEKGYTQKQIARKLGVSTRTVMRDWDKMRSYVKGQQNKELRETVEREKLLFPQKYSMSFNDAMEFLKQSQRDFPRRLQDANALPAVSSKPQGKKCREMEITLNLDFPAPNGFPTVSVSPAEGFRFSGKFLLRVNACKNGEKRELCNLHFSR